MLIDTLKLVIAGYLIAVAVCAVAGVHRPLLTYPWRAVYDASRMLLAAATLGRVRARPIARRAARNHRRRLRGLRFELGEMADSARSRLGRGESDEPSGSAWAPGDER